MTRFTAFAGTGILAAALFGQGWGQEPASQASDLIVHEWGTFTSMQGSDAVTLEGLHHEEEALPAFVHARSRTQLTGVKGISVPILHVTEKMETPVTYFYSEKGLRVRARVVFHHGLLSQWYPAAENLAPVEPARDRSPLDMSKIDQSALEWDVEVLPRGAGKDQVPAVGFHDPWQFARIPDSNCVRAAPRGPHAAPETERFLFYRGLGQFTLPIKAKTEAGSRLTIANQGREPLRHLFVLHVHGGRGEYSYLPRLSAGDSVTVTRPVSQDAPEIAVMVESLKGALRQSLVDEGLYPKEAEAMTRTWERSYFHTEGLRVLYIVPERVTERLLPLEITPAPKEMKRVLVGRLECITPEVETEVTQALRDRTSREPARRDAAALRLNRLGRFLEPHLRRALACAGDETVRESAREMLMPLQASR